MAGAEGLGAQPGGPRLYGPFDQFWRANGGIRRFGLPLTEVFPSNGMAAQWFERALLIYNPANPEPYRVQLQDLGWLAASQRCTEAPFARVSSGANSQYFQATGHNLSGKFLTYWKASGGLALFGYPLSEPFSEKSQANGLLYTVQYFEKAKMELHPEQTNSAYAVQLALLGAERLSSEGGATAFASQVTPSFYPQTAPAYVAPRPGVYPKMGHALDYSWVAGRVSDVSLDRGGPGPVPARPSYPPTIQAGPGPVFAPPRSLPVTYPNGVTVGTAERSDTSPPLSSITPRPPTPECSQMAADAFMPTGPGWNTSGLHDGDYVIVFGHLALPGETGVIGDRGRPYIVDRLLANP